MKENKEQLRSAEEILLEHGLIKKREGYMSFELCDDITFDALICAIEEYASQFKGVGQKEAFTLEDMYDAFAAGAESQDWNEKTGWKRSYTFEQWIKTRGK